MIEKTSDDKKYYQLTEDECRKLIKLGDEAMKNTYPESGKGYAVALMTKAGNIYTGVSYLSDTETLTMHSEATVLVTPLFTAKKTLGNHGAKLSYLQATHLRKQFAFSIDVVVVFEEDNQIKQIHFKNDALSLARKLQDENNQT